MHMQYDDDDDDDEGLYVSRYSVCI